MEGSKGLVAFPAYIDYADKGSDWVAVEVSKLQVASQKRSAGGAKVSFPFLLHTMLNEVEGTEQAACVSWLSHGRAFRVHDRNTFEATVRPKYFKMQSSYQSFQRQLNSYGFKRLVSIHSKKNAYYHEYFLRDRTALCSLMTRSNVSHTKRLYYDASTEPNFDRMKPLPVVYDAATPTSTHDSETNASPSTTIHGDVRPTLFSERIGESKVPPQRDRESTPYSRDLQFSCSPSRDHAATRARVVPAVASEPVLAFEHMVAFDEPAPPTHAHQQHRHVPDDQRIPTTMFSPAPLRPSASSRGHTWPSISGRPSMRETSHSMLSPHAYHHSVAPNVQEQSFIAHQAMALSTSGPLHLYTETNVLDTAHQSEQPTHEHVDARPSMSVSPRLFHQGDSPRRTAAAFMPSRTRGDGHGTEATSRPLRREMACCLDGSQSMEPLNDGASAHQMSSSVPSHLSDQESPRRLDPDRAATEAQVSSQWQGTALPRVSGHQRHGTFQNTCDHYEHLFPDDMLDNHSYDGSLSLSCGSTCSR